MIEPVEAIYRKGILELKERMDIADGTEVQVIVIPRDRLADAKSSAEAIARIAGQQMEREGGSFSGKDHDKVLYRPPDAQ